MNDIYNELLSEIFLRISQDHLLICKFVCKRWREIINNIDNPLLYTPLVGDLSNRIQYCCDNNLIIQLMNIINKNNQIYITHFNVIFKYVCKIGNTKCVEAIINIKYGKHSSRIKTADLDWGISIACTHGHKELVQTMIDKCGAKSFTYYLLFACEHGHKNIVEMLIKYGAKNFDAGLYEACKHGHKDICKLMVECGAKICRWCGQDINMNNHY